MSRYWMLRKQRSSGRGTPAGLVAVSLIGFGLLGSVPAQAQEEGATGRTSSVLIEEIMVTARKREEMSQEVPVAITAYSGDQLEALKIRTFDDLSVAMPNVAMDDIGTTRGVANFSIRGLGLNSSIPAIDPTVGVFIDGVYLGLAAGTVIDMFDLASIEVLRGPQGNLFGRNVTGGAVLVNTKGPTDEFEFSARGAIDGNPNGDGGTAIYANAAVSGPIGDSFGYRLSVYHNEDDGWFVNQFDGSDHGAASTTIFRPVLVWRPTDSLEMKLRWEHTDMENDGPSAQSHTNGLGIDGNFANFERDSFDFAIDEPGMLDLELDHVSFQVDWDVGFGDGTITNIFGWRDYYAETYGDIDGQPVWLFHSASLNDFEQTSNELRYNGEFGNANVTVGLYWFDSTTDYSEGRDLLGIATGGVAPAVTQDGGGVLDLTSTAIFGSVDFYVTDNLALTVGLRYSDEEKDAQIATLTLNTDAPCLVYDRTCAFDFVDSDKWDAVSGKLGFNYTFSDDARLYGYWARGHRSGGYNLRNTAVDTVNLGPGPFDQETVDSFELGFKSEFSGRGRFNAAVFYTDIVDMQRELNQADPFAGVVQIIRNTADAEIFGFEGEGTFAIGENTVLTASLGWIDPKYTSVIFDLNGDGVIDEADKALSLPRAAEWTYSVGFNHDWMLSSGADIAFRASYAYRDDSFYTDNNLGYLLDQEILSAGIDFYSASDRWTFSLYGQNLLNSVLHGGDTQLPQVIGPVPVGGTFSPLVKGRVVGLEVAYRTN
ncbi:MAG: TonB-dependent receptor [Woeseiaceae bacterium]|jgi:iron complex outermembrane recepter protein